MTDTQECIEVDLCWPELGEVKTMVDSVSSWAFLYTLRVVVRLVRVSVH